jgi:hypothetical protein
MYTEDITTAPSANVAAPKRGGAPFGPFFRAFIS